MFLLVDVWKKELFTSEDYKKIEEIQEDVGYHPSYSCELLLDDEGLLLITNSCSDVRYVDNSHYAFVKYILGDQDG